MCLEFTHGTTVAAENGQAVVGRPEARGQVRARPHTLKNLITFYPLVLNLHTFIELIRLLSICEFRKQIRNKKKWHSMLIGQSTQGRI